MGNSEIVLVTGGTGFVGIHCILRLLQKGYSVRTTLRTIGKKKDVIAMLRNGGILSSDDDQIDHLHFISADLTREDNWDEAMKDCKYVLHVASPTHSHSPKDENEMIRPAVDGVLRVLKAARKAGVARVVMTSSFGAVGFSNKNPQAETTEANWTDPNERGLSAYEKSKGLAERAAWDFMEKEGGLELAVINPVAIFGPSLGPSQSPSLGLLKILLDGSMKAIPNIPLNVVDIRDVADLHIRAMIHPRASGQRFIASADGKISLPEIAIFVKDKMPGLAAKVSTRTLPDWVVGIAAWFNPQAKLAAAFLKISRNVSNAKAKQVLGWTPIASKEQAVLASVESMIKFDLIK